MACTEGKREKAGRVVKGPTRDGVVSYAHRHCARLVSNLQPLA